MLARNLYSRMAQLTHHILYCIICTKEVLSTRLSATKFYSPIPAFSILFVPAVWSLCGYIITHE